jgi:molybdenum cofactor synthesis domain-containing protein
MKPFGTLIPFDEALRIIDDHITPIERVEKLGLGACLGRVLAEDVVAVRSTPPFDRAAMDGYAVKARDTFGTSRQNPRALGVVGVIYAGEKPQRKVAKGECIQIATGAVMPAGADAVVMIEDVRLEANFINVLKPAYPGANLAKAGEDIKAGETVLRGGQVLNPGKVGVIASQGMRRVPVYQRPIVAVIPTGEEIAESSKKLRPEQVYDINSYTIGAVVSENGGVALRFSIVGDTQKELRDAIAATSAADLVVFTGGSSVGESDLMFDILKEEGEVLFHGIQVKPGKPTMFAVVRGKPLLGMPGYPTSCLINAYLILLPALRKMAHLPSKRGVGISASLGERVPGGIGRRQFLPVRLEGDRAVPLFKESGAITGIARADGYIIVQENIDILEKGEPVTVILF